MMNIVFCGWKINREKGAFAPFFTDSSGFP